MKNIVCFHFFKKINSLHDIMQETSIHLEDCIGANILAVTIFSGSQIIPDYSSGTAPSYSFNTF
jgi:hypothetical protein